MDDFDDIQSEDWYGEERELPYEHEGDSPEPDIDEQKEWEDFGERYDNDGPDFDF
jgi:hypothetical protein